MKKTKRWEHRQKANNLIRIDRIDSTRSFKVLHSHIIILTILLFLSSFSNIIPLIKAPPITWLPELVDESIDAGDYNSLAFNSTGVPHIAYQRSEPIPSAVLYAYKIGTVWYNETVFEDTGIVGQYVSLAIDSMDKLHISFFANNVLYYSTNTSGLWTETIVDEDPFAIVGWYSSIAVDSSNNPRIAYYDRTNEQLKYAYYDTTWHTEVVDSKTNDDVGRFCSLALALDDTPHISYHYRTASNEGRLKHAWKTGNTWNDEIVSDQDFPGRYSSLVINNITGELHVSHYRLVGGDLLYSNNKGFGWTTEVLETTGDVGLYTSMALDGGGEPHIAHFDKTTAQIKRTWREIGSWYTETVVSPGPLSNHGCISIGMAQDNQPRISYYDADNGNQMYANGFAEFIDLTVVDVWLIPSGPFDKGDPVQIYANITNFGTQVSGPFIVRFYDGNPAHGGTQIGPDYNLASLEPGNYSIVNLSWTAGPIGTHHLYVEVNPDNVVLDPFQGNDNNYAIADVLGPKLILEPGWNLISLPLNQTNSSLLAVLDLISGDYDAVQAYIASDPFNDPWKHYQITKPDSLNDLKELNHLIGFWIHITNPGGTTLNITGYELLLPQSIILHPGWNLVGYPSLTSYNRTEGLNNLTFGSYIDSIWIYNATTKKWKELGETDYFEFGKGYWVHNISSTDLIWQVPL